MRIYIHASVIEREECGPRLTKEIVLYWYASIGMMDNLTLNKRKMCLTKSTLNPSFSFMNLLTRLSLLSTLFFGL